MSQRPPVFLVRLPLAEAASWPMARSWMGGLPRLGEFDWPHRRGMALHFLAQIDLGDLARHAPASGLPTSGSLAFFADLVGWQQWHVRHVPGDQMALPETPQPPDLPPPYVTESGRDFYRSAPSLAAVPRILPRWPVALRRSDLGDDAGEQKLKAELAATHPPPQVTFDATLLRDQLPNGQKPFLAQALTMMVDAWIGDIAWNETLQAKNGQKAAALGEALAAMGIRLGPDEPWRKLVISDQAAAVKAALEGRVPTPPARPQANRPPPVTTLGRIFRALQPKPEAPPPAPQIPLPPPAALGEQLRAFNLAQSAAVKAGATAARLRAYLPRLQALAQGRNPLAPLTEADLAPIEALVYEFGDRPTPDSFPRYRCTYMGGSDLATDLLFWLVRGDAARRQLLPEAARALIDQSYLVPTKSAPLHRIFGRGATIQDGAGRPKGGILLLQLGWDPFVDLHLGDAGTLQFWITPEALAARDFNAVTMTSENH